MNFLKKEHKIWVMTLMNVLGAFDNLKGMTNHSYNPSLILKVIFHSSLRGYESDVYVTKVHFQKKLGSDGPTIMSNKSSSLGMGNLYLTVIRLMARLSTHILQLPSFFGKSNASTTYGLNLSNKALPQ